MTTDFTPQDAKRLRRDIGTSLGQGPVVLDLGKISALLDLVDALAKVVRAAEALGDPNVDCDEADELAASLKEVRQGPHACWLERPEKETQR